MKYKIEYNFGKYKFVFSTDNYETLKKQQEHIAEFYIPNTEALARTINIEVIEDENKFGKYIELCTNQKNIKYQSFSNQIHYEYNVDNKRVFIIDNNEYICIKIDDDNYMIITDGKEQSVKWPFRILREIFVRLEEDERKLFMHGTGVSINNNEGILLLGGSGSGKTSLAIKMIESGDNVNFYSNDRMFLYKKENCVEMSYYPIPVVYAMGTVKNNNNLDAYFKNTRILEQRAKKSYESSNVCDKVDVPLTVQDKIFSNVQLKTNCKVKLIVFPKLVKMLEDDAPIVIVPDDNYKRILLEQNCFTPFDWESLRLPWIYQRKSSMEEIISNKYNLLNYVLENTKIIELKYGLNVNPKKLIKEIKRRI